MAQRVVECFSGLAGERTPGSVGDGAGEHNWQLNAQRFEFSFNRENSGFGIEGIENGFNQDQVTAAFHQRFGGFAVGSHQLIKGNIAVSRVVDVGRDRRRTVGWAKHARDVARFVRRARRPFVCRRARQFGCCKVDFRRQGFHLVIRHGNSRGVEGVGFDDVRARLEVGVMNRGDHLRFAEHQQVVVAFQIARPFGKAFAAEILFAQTISLDHGAHTAVQHQNTFI